MEKFYCVGCKQHYELKVHTPQRQASKGGSYRHSLISECPKGHRVNKLCKKEVYETYSETFESPYAGSKALSGISLTTDQLTETIGSGTFDEASLNSSGHQNIFANAEEGNTPVQDPMEFGEMANWTPLDGTPSLKKRKRAEDYRAEILTKSEWDSYADEIKDLENKLDELEKQLSSFTTLTWRSWIGLPDRMPSEITSPQDRKIYQKMESINTEAKKLLKKMYPDGMRALYTDKDEHGDFVSKAGVKHYSAEGMTVGVNLEALAPTPDEPETGESLVPADSLLPEGSGHVIGSQSTSHNFTPFHAEVAYAVSWEGKEDNNEGLIYGIEYTDEVGDVADVEWFSTAEERDEELARYLEQYGAEDHRLDAETFIAYPELKDHLVSIMPDKVYGITSLDDGDFEMKVANRYMDEVIEAVSNYQQTQSDSDLMFGQSKTKIALAAAGVAVLGAWIWNNRK